MSKIFLALHICSVGMPWNCEDISIRLFTANNTMQCWHAAPSVVAEKIDLDNRDRRIFKMECKESRQ